MDTWVEANRKAGGRQETPGMMYQVGTMFPGTYLEQNKTGPKLKATNFRIPIETFLVVQTDANGRFELKGIGKDQMLFVSLSGPGIAKDVIAVITRDMKTLRADGWYMNGLSLGNGSTFCGSKFDHVSAQSSPVKGVVRDIKTTQPIAGALVTVTTTAGKGVSRNAWLTATTDEQGRYEIRGLPTAIEKVASPNRLTVIAHGSPYLKTIFDVPSSRSPEAIEFNPELHRAVLATGVLTNLRTGKPVQGSFYYSPFINNDTNARYPQYSDNVTGYEGQDPHFHTDKNGRFALPVIPGRGLIGVICDENIYRVSFGKNDIPEFKDYNPRQGSLTSDTIQASSMHVLRAIDVPDSEEEFEVNLQADHGHKVDVRFVDADGKPVMERLSVLGVAARQTGYAQTSDGTVTAYGLEPDLPRIIYVSNNDKSLAAVAELTTESSTVTIKLAPLTEVTGLLAGVKGKPLKQRYITANASNWQMQEVVKPVKTDGEGHFVLQVPVSGPYRLMTETKGHLPLRVKNGLMVNGKTLDVGTVKLSGPKKTAESKVESKTSNTKPSENLDGFTGAEISVSGVVVDEQSKPIVGAELLTPFLKVDSPTSLDDVGSRKVGTSDSDGRFRIKFTDEFARHGKTQLIARMPGRGIGGLRLELRDLPESVKIVLSPERIIRGKLVTTEGQPIVGAELSIQEVLSRKILGIVS